MMQPLILLLFLSRFLALLATGIQGVSGWSHPNNKTHPKLFVFGDSYADTGNTPISLSHSWKVPYGVTFPGKPSGRFSDGRVLTDYFARHLGVRSPIPYRWRKCAGDKVSAGMNFAHGGTGAFQTLVPGPNMTTQIHFFRRLVADSVFSAADVNSSIALVTLSGNDYTFFQSTNGSSAESLENFITRLVNQLALNLKIIKEVGVKTVVVGGLPPFGCLPSVTDALSFKSCDSTKNGVATLHNHLLNQAVAELNAKAKPLPPPFFILDLYSAFMSAINNTKANRGGERGKFGNPLQPCCIGKESNYSCGNTDGSGAKMYTLCEDRDSAFFWDSVHPTQRGWSVVYSALLPSLHKISQT